MDINSALRGIGANTNKGLTNLENNSTRKADGKVPDNGAATVANNEEKVTLTSAASRLGQLIQENNTKPEVDAERVATLKAAIQEGSFKPNVASIALRLMNFENQLKG